MIEDVDKKVQEVRENTNALTPLLKEIIVDGNKKLPSDKIEHETWEFTLEDETTVEKEVVLWTSEA